MPQSNNPYHLRDTTLLTGWLFADLLLGLMMIFLVAIPRVTPPPPVPPVLIVTPLSLDPTNPACSGGTDNPQCTITVEEASTSQGSMTWAVSSDMVDTNTIKYSSAAGTLTPGMTVKVNISDFPCQNGSFTFTGSREATAETIRWHCTPRQIRLETTYNKLYFTVSNYNDLINGSQSAINDLENQIRRKIPSGYFVGLAIVYDGAPDPSANPGSIDTADNVDKAIYQVLRDLGKQGFAFQNASYYGNLFNLYQDHSSVEIDVYYFTR